MNEGWKEIVSEKGGEIIKEGEDMFSEHTIRCKNLHTFSLFSNDILLGGWCEKCSSGEPEEEAPDTIIGDALHSLSIPYRYSEVVDGKEFDYVIEVGKKRFIILISPVGGTSSSLAGDDEVTPPEGWNLIIIKDEKVLDLESLKKWVWTAIKNDEKLTILPPPEEKKIEESEPVKHGCDILTTLYKAGKSSSVCSITKEALKPYPINVNYGVAYIRVSTNEQAKDGFSLEAQERQLFEETLRRDMFLKKIYIDRGISGGSTEKRAALAKMREELVDGDWVFACYVSRMARNTIDLLSIADEIEKKDCHLVVQELKMDITSPAGKLVLTMLASQAQFEREQVSEKVKSVIKHLKETGKFRSKPPIGWKMNPDKKSLEIHIRNEEEIKIIQQIRRLRNKFPDLKITPFTRKVNEKKIPSPRSGKKWHHSTLKRMMLREGMEI